MQYNFRVVKTFRIVIGKGMVNDYWTVCVYGIVVCLGYNMTIG